MTRHRWPVDARDSNDAVAGVEGAQIYKMKNSKNVAHFPTRLRAEFDALARHPLEVDGKHSKSPQSGLAEQ